MSLLTIQAQSHAYSMLVQRRPRHKFTGDNRSIDFESYLHQCQALMNIPGATDGMKLAELPYWFSGTAELVIDRFIGESDAIRALADAFRALTKEFGRRRLTAKQMLVEQLQGEKLIERNNTQIKTFIVNLEKIYKIAQETKREESFSLPETINDIIRAKLPHLASKWAKKVADVELTEYDDEAPALSFLQFISFAKKQNSVSQTMGDILRSSTETNRAVQRPAFRIAAGHTEVGWQQPIRGNRTPIVEPCTFCPGAEHRTADCRKFAAYTNIEKATVVRDRRLCTSCLGHTSQTHQAMNCATRTGCGTCGERHHTLLHGIPYRQLRLNAGAPRANAEWAQPPL